MKEIEVYNNFFKNIFSVKNYYIYKVITVLGVKVKFKSKKLLKRYGVKRNSFFEDIFSVKNDGIRKVVTIFGLKIGFKSDRLLQRSRISDKNVVCPSFKTLSTLLSYYCSEVKSFNSENVKSATILIPVYNGLEYLKKLIPSLISNTPPSANVIIIDDCSSDREVGIYLDELKRKTHYTIIKNERNLGFVKTVNRGMSLITTKYAIWLNSDTVVPEKWLERLLYPFDDVHKIATATPFSNSAVMFSFPLFGQDNEMRKTLAETDALFQHVECNDIALNNVYSGVGFCMAIDMRSWKEVGRLDEVNFGLGYGEENDWCFRARRNGWSHVLIPNLFVQHNHGKSFGTKKQRLVDKHLKILRLKYPKEMDEVVPSFINADPWRVYRQLASVLYCKKNPLLFIDLNPKSLIHSGSIVYRNNLINEFEKQGYSVLILQYEMNKSNAWTLVPHSCSSDIEINLSTLMEIKLLFGIIPIRKVVINNLAFLEDVEETSHILTKLKKQYGFHLSYKFHDYLSVCPSFFLLNDRCENCESYIETKSCAKCLLRNNHLVVSRRDITRWRRSWENLFKNADEFNFFSNYSLEKVEKVYPFIRKKSTVVEHEVKFPKGSKAYVRPKDAKELTFAFVGNFCMEKGAKLFIEFISLLQRKNVNAKGIVLGINNYGNLPKNVIYISQYTRSNMGELLTKNKVHAVICSSILNETFSYVAQELMLLNVPLVVFNNGAPAERIEKYSYKLGRVSNMISAQGLYEETKLLLKQIYSINI